MQPRVLPTLTLSLTALVGGGLMTGCWDQECDTWRAPPPPLSAAGKDARLESTYDVESDSYVVSLRRPRERANVGSAACQKTKRECVEEVRQLKLEVTPSQALVHSQPSRQRATKAAHVDGALAKAAEHNVHAFAFDGYRYLAHVVPDEGLRTVAVGRIAAESAIRQVRVESQLTGVIKVSAVLPACAQQPDFNQDKDSGLDDDGIRPCLLVKRQGTAVPYVLSVRNTGAGLVLLDTAQEEKSPSAYLAEAGVNLRTRGPSEQKSDNTSSSGLEPSNFDHFEEDCNEVWEVENQAAPWLVLNCAQSRGSKAGSIYAINTNSVRSGPLDAGHQPKDAHIYEISVESTGSPTYVILSPQTNYADDSFYAFVQSKASGSQFSIFALPPGAEVSTKENDQPPHTLSGTISKSDIAGISAYDAARGTLIYTDSDGDIMVLDVEKARKDGSSDFANFEYNCRLQPAPSELRTVGWTANSWAMYDRIIGGTDTHKVQFIDENLNDLPSIETKGEIRYVAPKPVVAIEENGQQGVRPWLIYRTQDGMNDAAAWPIE